MFGADLFGESPGSSGGGGGGSSTFIGLSDVSIGSLTDGDYLTVSGGAVIQRVPSDVRTDLGLVIGTDVQAFSSNLGTLAGLTLGTFGLTLLGDPTAASARTDLGLVIGTNVQAHSSILDGIVSNGTTATGLSILDAASGAAVASIIGAVAQGSTFQAADGVAATPGLTFQAEPGTGLYRGGAGQLAFTFQGNDTWFLNDSKVRGPNGNQSFPSYTFLTTTGSGMFNSGTGAIFGDAAKSVGLAAGGQALIFDGNGSLGLSDGSASKPALTFQNDPDNGIYRALGVGADIWRFVSNNMTCIEISGQATPNPGLGFFGHAASTQPGPYTVTNPTVTRSLDETTVTLSDVSKVLGTLINDLQSVGLVG